ncbi:PTS sugar transporter subunit IIB [Paenibacillus sp. J2TS4]|uniref:PTS sugar transporter subunit IIB n=1 Tax=Paenibacillus sp. J2TS4 TaxID=2807194 RepID=UPI001B1D7FD5|nr:PTS sugar transporter subunit IIB [Paenibacillus sp. J2TS4]GIP35098.1 PTS sugar transporter subunit IIB [Paenibacillus sp. J2TS4]
MKTILVVCSSGLGTSLMIRLHLTSILQEIGLKAHVEQSDSSSIDLYNADLIIGARQIVAALDIAPDIERIALDSLTDKEHLRERLLASSWFQQGMGNGVDNP